MEKFADMHSLKIENKTGYGYNTKIFVDGIEKKNVTKLRLYPIVPDEILKCDMEFFVGWLDVDVEIPMEEIRWEGELVNESVIPVDTSDIVSAGISLPDFTKALWNEFMCR